MSKAAAVASGSWFHNRIVDGKKDSLCTVVLLYDTTFFCVYISAVVLSGESRDSVDGGGGAQL